MPIGPAATLPPRFRDNAIYRAVVARHEDRVMSPAEKIPLQVLPLRTVATNPDSRVVWRVPKVPKI
jgi:hypothetical protein